MENNIAVALHQEAMDLYDFGKIKKAKGGSEEAYLQDMKKAFILDLEAALLIQNVAGEELRHATYPRSAGWLAYKCNRFVEAKQLALLGLSHKTNIDAYEISKLEDLLAKTEKKIKKLDLKEDVFNNSTFAVVTSANIDTKILQIRPIGHQSYQQIKVAADRIIQIARLFLGQTVEIDLKKDKQGQMTLQNIRRAA